MSEQENENIVTLKDEDGNDVNFEHLMTLQHEGAEYVVLEATEDMEDCQKGEDIILRIEKDENDADIFVTIEDEDELQAVLDKCVAIIEEQDEEGDDE